MPVAVHVISACFARVPLILIPPGVFLLSIPGIRRILLLSPLFLLALPRLFGRILSGSPTRAVLGLHGRRCTTSRDHHRIKDPSLPLRSNFIQTDGRDIRSEGDVALLAVSRARGVGWGWRDLPAIRHGFCAPILPAGCTSGQSRAMLTEG